MAAVRTSIGIASIYNCATSLHKTKHVGGNSVIGVQFQYKWSLVKASAMSGKEIHLYANLLPTSIKKEKKNEE
jgi:hypothetical protein